MKSSQGKARSEGAKARLDEQTRAMREILWGTPGRVRDYFGHVRGGSTQEHDFLVALPGEILSLAAEGRVPSQELRQILEKVARGRLEEAMDALNKIAEPSRKFRS